MLRPYQQAAREAIEKEWNEGRKNTLLVLPTGCHAGDQLIMMASGRTKAAKDVKVGDRLMGPDGEARTVLCLHNGTGDMYKVIPVKGDSYIVSADHIIPTVTTNLASKPKYPSEEKGGTVELVRAKEWASKSNNWKHTHKMFRSELVERFEGCDESKATIDPYFLGILLGDGGLKHTINVTTQDLEVVKEIERQASKYGMTIETKPAGKATTYCLKVGRRIGRNGGKLHQQLCQLDLRYKGSYDKRIPECYKFANAETRLEILAGLMDSDGSMHGNGYDFISASRQLAEDVVFVARSLGLAAYMRESVKTAQNGFTGIYWRVFISGHCSIIPCRVKYKKAGERKQKKNVLRTGFKVVPVGSAEYYGFTVDGDNLYLLGDFTVTHNCGKTIVFTSVVEDRVAAGDRCLILAHRGELLDQAADKLYKNTGLKCSIEKASDSCLDSFFRVTVGSVQTLMRQKRLDLFPRDYFGTIVIDEAHHSTSDSYTRILEHFDEAKVLGVTATPDRGDMRSLGQVFDSIAYEYTMPEAIREGYLCPIKAQTVPLDLDLTGVGVAAGDFKAGELGSALEPYLEQIASVMESYCADRKTVVFLPLVAISQKFRDILNTHGFSAAEVNGNSSDRAEVLRDFETGKYNVLCNSMLLTEGWDCPEVDCVIVLRPTKVRSLYRQMVGRGSRIAPGKDHLLLLDFLWHTDRHQLCHPASLICTNDEVARQMTKNLETEQIAMDIIDAEKDAESDVMRQREEALAEQLRQMRKRKAKLVDPLQYEMSIYSEDLANYVPAFGYEMKPPSQGQLTTLEKFGIDPDGIECAGKASLIIDKLINRKNAGLSTPKQIRFLENRGFKRVGTWSFEDASKMIGRISANGWRIPRGIHVATYQPGSVAYG